MEKFFTRHERLCKQAFKGKNLTHSDFRTPKGQEMIQLARKELVYSDSTGSGDIFYTLYYNWKKLWQN